MQKINLFLYTIFMKDSIVHQCLELLKREEALDSLMSKSKDLSSVSVEFYKKAKSANNKCCKLY